MTGYIRLGAGADSLQNFGEVGVEIRGGPDDDEIVNGGIAPSIRGRVGDDVITLISGAKSTVINGGVGNDTLVFKFAWLSPLDFQAIEAAVASNLAAGSLSVAGQTYTWSNMEQLANNSTLRAAQVPTLSDLALILLGLTLGYVRVFSSSVQDVGLRLTITHVKNGACQGAVFRCGGATVLGCSGLISWTKHKASPLLHFCGPLHFASSFRQRYMPPVYCLTRCLRPFRIASMSSGDGFELLLTGTLDTRPPDILWTSRINQSVGCASSLLCISSWKIRFANSLPVFASPSTASQYTSEIIACDLVLHPVEPPPPRSP